MCPTIDHVHHRYRQHMSAWSAQRSPKWNVELLRCRFGCCEGYGQHGVCSKTALVRCAVEIDHGSVNRSLIDSVKPFEYLSDLPVDVGDRLGHTLTHPCIATVSKLDGLMSARRSARGGNRPSTGTRIQEDLGLYRRVTPGVEDLAADHDFNCAQADSHIDVPTTGHFHATAPFEGDRGSPLRPAQQR